ncbi:DUF4372 domain-containing protein [Treponema phagedenis]|uniref:DUF4372 domain-containing protein n=1 Tax=Treponema phagedenis TaxID=162 RepID=UPI001652BDD5|nr:DUF4372 domain-containing protein [Treponema phagedenis]
MNKYNTILGQLLEPISFVFSRSQFEKLVIETNAEKGAKGFSCWQQFVSLVFAQTTGQTSLRGIEQALKVNRSSFYHLNIIRKINRSTLSYANNNRPCELYEQLFYYLSNLLQSIKPKHQFKFKNPLYSIDATTIDLCRKTFPWS